MEILPLLTQKVQKEPYLEFGNALKFTATPQKTKVSLTNHKGYCSGQLAISDLDPIPLEISIRGEEMLLQIGEHTTTHNIKYNPLTTAEFCLYRSIKGFLEAQFDTPKQPFGHNSYIHTHGILTDTSDIHILSNIYIGENDCGFGLAFLSAPCYIPPSLAHRITCPPNQGIQVPLTKNTVTTSIPEILTYTTLRNYQDMCQIIHHKNRFLEFLHTKGLEQPTRIQYSSTQKYQYEFGSNPNTVNLVFDFHTMDVSVWPYTPGFKETIKAFDQFRPQRSEIDHQKPSSINSSLVMA